MPVLTRAALGAVAGWLIAVVLVDGSSPSWRGGAAAAVMALGIGGAPALDTWSGRGVTSGWTLAAALGIYVGVPETDRAAGVIAVLLVVVAAELFGRGRVDGLIGAGLVAVLVWTAVAGAAGRGGALVAALATTGMLALIGPLSAAPAPPRRIVPVAWRDPVLVALQLAFAVGIARVGGVRTTTSGALLVVAIATPVLAVAAWLTIGPPPAAVRVSSTAGGAPSEAQ